MIQRSIIEDCFKVVAVNQMKLRTGMISLEVSDIGDKSQMLRRKSNELSKSSMTVPFRDLLAILEARLAHRTMDDPKEYH